MAAHSGGSTMTGDPPAALRAFADSITHPMVAFDRVGEVVYANDAFCALAGRALEALRAARRPVLRAPILDARGDDRTWVVPVGRARIERADGALLPVRVDAIPIGAAAGDVHLCTVRPAAELGVSALDRRLDDERMRELLANLPGGVYRCTYDRRWRTVFLSERFADICGHPSEEFLEPYGRSFLEVVEPEDVPIIKDAVRAAIKARAPYEVEFRVIRPDGEPRWVLDRGLPLADPDGKVRWLEGAMFDVTARKVAEASASARRQFLTVMSHEMRTPLNAIIGLTSLLLDSALGPRERDFIETIRLSGDALLDVVDDILDFSRIDAGRVELVEAPFAIGDVIDEVWSIAAPAAAGKPVALLHRIDEALPSRVRGDGARLRQVLVNLVGNAIKFTADGAVDLVAERVEQSEGQVTVAFSVRDTGIGVSPARQAQLFEAFEQADASTTRVHGGTGLGLAICKRLVALMGGTLSLESAPGAGSTFGVRVTLEVVDPVTIGEARRRYQAARALVVDDREDAAARLVERLARRGVAAEATRWSSARLGDVERFDLVVVARDLGRVPGGAVVAAIRAVAGLRAPRLVLLDPPGAGLIEAEHRPDVVLDEPVGEAALDRALARLLAGRSARAPEPTEPRSNAPLPPLRVLLAEDNPVNCKVALALLSRLGLTASVARNGQEALDAWATGDYDVVLMDVQMPVLDGLEATRRLRARWGEGPRIIALTANATAADRERCLEAGMDDFLGKPLRAGALEEALRAAASATARGG